MSEKEPKSAVDNFLANKKVKKPLRSPTKADNSAIGANLTPEDFEKKLNAKHFELSERILKMENPKEIFHDDSQRQLMDEFNTGRERLLLRLQNSEKLEPEARENALNEIQRDISKFSKDIEEKRSELNSVAWVLGLIGIIAIVALIWWFLSI